MDAHLYRTWEPADSYKNPHKWKGTSGMVCEKRTCLKRLFCKADVKNIVLEAGGQEQGIRVSGNQVRGQRGEFKKAEQYLTSSFRPSTYVVGGEYSTHQSTNK
jgi:hypothetical protein